MSYLLNTYKRLPVTFSHGKGVWLWDQNGKRYLDGLSGIAVNALGYAHPKLTEAISRQATRLIHVSNYYEIAEQDAAAERIARLSGLDRVFFGNSGAEANEGLIKLARLHAHQLGVAEPQIVVMTHAFHGRTLATVSATANVNAKKGFEPLLPGFIRVPFNDIQALRCVVQANPSVVAILMEAVQGEGGVLPGETAYLQQVRALCDERRLLMLLDEIQCGLGRTGAWFGYQHAGILPDAISLAKALGGGLPIGAFAVRQPYADYFQPGSHGSTFGGNPLATVAVCATLDAIEAENLVDNARLRGAQLLDTLRQALADVTGVIDIRGLGLMVGVELDRPCGEIVGMALEHGLLVSVTAGNVVRLLPPLIVNQEDISEMADLVAAVVCDFLGTSG